MVKFDNNVEEKIFYKIVKLRPESFLGLAKFFNIKILTETVDKETKKAIPRSAEEITVDIINEYSKLNRKQRRAIDKIIDKAIKDGD